MPCVGALRVVHDFGDNKIGMRHLRRDYKTERTKKYVTCLHDPDLREALSGACPAKCHPHFSLLFPLSLGVPVLLHCERARAFQGQVSLQDAAAWLAAFVLRHAWRVRV